MASFDYDALGQRIRKVDHITPANTRIYYYNDNWQVLAEYDGSDTFQRYRKAFAKLLLNLRPGIFSADKACKISNSRNYGRFCTTQPDGKRAAAKQNEFQNDFPVYGNYIDEPLVMVTMTSDSTTDLYYAQDHLYSTAALIDTAGNVVERYEYNAYGKATIYDSNFNPDADNVTNHGNPYLYTGRRLDILDNGSLKLQYSRHRYYDAQTGRFLQKDPLGIVPHGNRIRLRPTSQYKDGLNAFQYSQCEPLKYSDPIGTDIYLVGGKGPHQKVCVDLWRIKVLPEGEYTWEKEDKACFSFALDYHDLFGFTRPKKTWLGFKTPVLTAGCYEGHIYQDESNGSVISTKTTTRKEDQAWYWYMVQKRVGTRDIYTLDWYNCRKYSKLEYNAAPKGI